MREFNITDAKGGAAFTVTIIPQANRSEIVGIQRDGTLKISLTAPATGQEANEVLIEFLAALLDVHRSQVEIVAGHNGRDKIVSVINVSPADVERSLVGSLTDEMDG
jgi:uncharacterized protein (TIGR00251 family)